jgi:acyl carrier protein
MKPFNTIVAKIFKIKESEVKDEMSSKDIPEWDSMNYLLFIAELEQQFSVSFSMDEVMNAATLGDIRKALDSRTK